MLLTLKNWRNWCNEFGTGPNVGNRCRMRTTVLELHTGTTESVTDITPQCATFVAETGGDGLLNVFVPHSPSGGARLDVGARSADGPRAALPDPAPPDAPWPRAP